MQLTPGQKLTIISIGVIAQTTKTEMTVRQVFAQPQGKRVGTYKPRGKRKEFYLQPPDECLIFEGWDIPIKTDGELKHPDGGKGFTGNACFNLGGPAELVKDWVENKALNQPVPDEVKGLILVIPVDANGKRVGGLHDDGEPLYPEIRTNHSALENRKANAKLAAAAA